MGLSPEGVTSDGWAPLTSTVPMVIDALAVTAIVFWFLAVTAGGLRRWLLHHHGDPGTVRLRVPVSLHSEHDDAANCRDGGEQDAPPGHAEVTRRHSRRKRRSAV